MNALPTKLPRLFAGFVLFACPRGRDTPPSKDVDSTLKCAFVFGQIDASTMFFLLPVFYCFTVTRTTSNGIINVAFNVVTKDLKKFGFNVGSYSSERLRGTVNVGIPF